MLRRERYLVLWPVYFDSGKSRSEGRRVPKRVAVPSPKASEILEAARRLGFKAVLEEGKRYPSSWWEASGRVLVAPPGLKKTEVIRAIAEELRKMRKIE